MGRMCVWCGSELDEDNAPEDSEMKRHAGDPLAGEPRAGDAEGSSETAPTICRRCAEGLATYRKPVLVVSRDWARVYDQLVELLKGQSDIQVILDRRESPGPGAEAGKWDGPDRRKKGQSLIVE